MNANKTPASYISEVFSDYKNCKCLNMAFATVVDVANIRYMCLDCENLLDHLSRQGVLNISDLNLKPRCCVSFCSIAPCVRLLAICSDKPV